VNTTASTEDYLSRLRRELADLPAGEVDEIVEDLEPQLVEIVEEGDVLADRLGTPAEYARELRAAAGFRTSRSPQWLPRTMFWLLVVSSALAAVCGFLAGLVESSVVGFLVLLLVVALAASWGSVALGRPATSEVAGLPEVRGLTSLLTRSRRVIEYLTTLQPAWFLVRAFLVWLGLVWLFRELNLWDAWPEVLATAVAVFTPVVGYRTRHDRRWLWLSLPLTAWATGVALRVLVDWDFWSSLMGAAH
jgi:uncharacterized membrane protein